MHPLRAHKSYFAFMAHRISGLALLLFLPLHFLFLGSAFDGADGMNRLLVYTNLPLVKLAEWGLVSLLALHALFGLRILILEFSNWPHNLTTLGAWVVPGFAAGAIVGIAFLARVFAA